MMFRDREEAGLRLLSRLGLYKNRLNTLVLAIPRGGLVPGILIARGLQLPLDIVVIRKIWAPWASELAIGAIAQDGTGILNESAIRTYEIPSSYIEEQIDEEKHEVERRLALYRPGMSPVDVSNKIILLVDDGVATGSTVLAAIAFLRRHWVSKIVLVTPVIARSSFDEIQRKTDDIIALSVPVSLGSVGEFYESFPPVSDQDVIDVMETQR